MIYLFIRFYLFILINLQEGPDTVACELLALSRLGRFERKTSFLLVKRPPAAMTEEKRLFSQCTNTEVLLWNHLVVFPYNYFIFLLTYILLLTLSEHIHWGNPDAPICPEFILGKCKNGSQCTGHHCILPYQWQYLDRNDHEWKNLNEEDNERLEKMYCDETLEKSLNTGIYKSFERHVTILCSSI